MKYKCTQCGEVCEVKTTTKMLPNRCVFCKAVSVSWIPAVEVSCKKCYRKRIKKKKEINFGKGFCFKNTFS